MKQYNVAFVLVPTIEATDDQVQEWVEYKTGYRGSMSMDNPLVDYDLTTNSLTVGPH